MQQVLLGIDTSNYRTSLCLVREDGQIVAESKRLLNVKEGKRGLQQSEAVFQHVINLPELSDELVLPEWNVVGICASSKPRPVEKSYMPVFKVGEGLARSLSVYLKVPYYLTSHQEGHIAAGENTVADKISSNRFLAVHLSGGTSEILVCERQDEGYSIEKIGGTQDLHAGQLVDRVGVALGLQFPAGPYLEQLGKKAEGTFAVPSSVNGLTFSFSGPEAALLRAIQHQTAAPEEIARACEQCVANTLEKTLRTAIEQGNSKEILIVGGVAANTYIRERLIKRLEHRAVGAKLTFCDPVYSGDNAYGVAMLGWLKHKNRTLKE
ncbi:O-sialoglycoprotein endopeptidase [Brevibacillus ginsengisoli]|uniref:Kae1-like domain-containing protein n=1 Tax=Brevibacillus ginsengisoli TaxID=363854 RepID=UPI003CF77102